MESPGWWTTSVAHTLTLAAVVTAVVTIARAAYRYIVKPTYDATVGDKLDKLAEGLTTVAEDMARQIAKVDEQLHTNGGASLRDQTMRIEATVSRNEQALSDHKREALDLFRAIHADVQAANRRIDQILNAQSGGDGLRRTSDIILPANLEGTEG